LEATTKAEKAATHFTFSLQHHQAPTKQLNNEIHRNFNLRHPGSHLSSVSSLQVKFIVPSRRSRWRTNLQSLLVGELSDDREGSIEEETCLLPPNSRHYPCRKRPICTCSMIYLFSPIFCEVMAGCEPSSKPNGRNRGSNVFGRDCGTRFNLLERKIKTK
jgi:hypothetical protein